MSHEIRNVIDWDGGAYIKIGFRWYRLEAISDSECEEAETIIEARERAALKAIGLKGKP